MKKNYILFILILTVILISGCNDQQNLEFNSIMVDNNEVKIGESFRVELLNQKYELKLIDILNENSIEIEYLDSLVGSPPHQGPCSEVNNAKYEEVIYSGSCLITNSCDGGEKICFDIIKEDFSILLTYSIEQVNWGIPP